jgi:hypothetical protein
MINNKKDWNKNIVSLFFGEMAKYFFGDSDCFVTFVV